MELLKYSNRKGNLLVLRLKLIRNNKQKSKMQIQNKKYALPETTVTENKDLNEQIQIKQSFKYAKEPQQKSTITI